MTTKLTRRWWTLALALAAGWHISFAMGDESRYPPAPPVYVGDEGATPLEQRVLDLEARLREQEQQYEALRREMRLPVAALAEEAPAEKKKDESKVKEYAVGADNKMSAVWKNGLEFTSPGKDFRVHVGGRTQIDGVWLDAEPLYNNTGGSSVGDADSVNFRRGRIRIDGDCYGTMDWCIEYDFFNNVNIDAGTVATDANGRVVSVPAPTDVWWTFKELPIVGNIRIGNQKEPIGLEHLTSSRFLDFMERSFNQDLFTGPFNNGFTPGIAMSRTILDERASLNLGVYKNTNNVFAYGVGDGEYAATGRVTWLPYYDEESNGRSLIHLGASGSFRDADENRVRQRSRASLRNGPGAFNPVLIDSGFVAADNQKLVGLEAAAVFGPLLLQSEFVASYVDDIAGGPQYGTYFTNGYYVEALYFLTGEQREYENRFGGGAFGRVVPYENAFLVKDCNGGWLAGRGAWQLGARYSKGDLRDSGIDGGIAQDFTLGLNWFLNPNTKVQWNYVLTWRDAPGTSGVDNPLLGDGEAHGFGVRFAHDF